MRRAALALLGVLALAACQESGTVKHVSIVNYGTITLDVTGGQEGRGGNTVTPSTDVQVGLNKGTGVPSLPVPGLGGG